jgi:hypothetical protein
MKDYIRLRTYEKLQEFNYSSGSDVYSAVSWFMDIYSIHISVIPIKRRGEMSIKYQYRVIDFRVNFSDIEILFEHQYNGSLPEYNSSKDAFDNAIDYAITLI